MGEGSVTLKPGDKVIYRGGEYPEYGIVVHSWLNEHSDEDCYVAFFGAGVFFPKTSDQLIVKPYVLRYFASSLELEESSVVPCPGGCGGDRDPRYKYCPECQEGASILDASAIRNLKTKAKLIDTVPVEHLHGDLVTVCKDDCPGCAWERERAALLED